MKHRTQNLLLAVLMISGAFLLEGCQSKLFGGRLYERNSFHPNYGDLGDMIADISANLKDGYELSVSQRVSLTEPDDRRAVDNSRENAIDIYDRGLERGQSMAGGKTGQLADVAKEAIERNRELATQITITKAPTNTVTSAVPTVVASFNLARPQPGSKDWIIDNLESNDADLLRELATIAELNQQEEVTDALNAKIDELQGRIDAFGANVAAQDAAIAERQDRIRDLQGDASTDSPTNNDPTFQPGVASWVPQGDSAVLFVPQSWGVVRALLRPAGGVSPAVLVAESTSAIGTLYRVSLPLDPRPVFSLYSDTSDESRADLGFGPANDFNTRQIDWEAPNTATPQWTGPKPRK